MTLFWVIQSGSTLYNLAMSRGERGSIMNLDFLPAPIKGMIQSLPQHLRDAAPIAQGVAAIVAFLAALGLVIGVGTGSLGSGSGGNTPPATTVPSTTQVEPTTSVPTTTVEPTTTVPTTTTVPVEPADDFTVTASGTPGAVVLVVNGTAPGTSLINLNYDGGVVGYVLAEEGPYQFSSYEPLDITTPTIEVELTYASCTPNWGECDTDSEQTFSRTVTVDYL